MARSPTVRYTYEDYLSIPVGTPGRHEIVDGELFVTAAPRFRHQKVVLNLARILADLADRHGLGEVVPGPVTVHIHDELVLEPDVVFIAWDRLHIVDPEGATDRPIWSSRCSPPPTAPTTARSSGSTTWRTA